MAFDAFLQVSGIPGESQDDKHKDWSELLSFSHNVTQTASATKSSAGGASAERVDFSDYTVTKLVDKMSPKLYEACAKGTHIPTVTIEVCRAGGDKQKYYEVKMEDVMVTHVAPGGSAGSDFPSESISFNFGKIKWTYTQQKRADGSGGGNVTGGWDLMQNKVNA